MPGRWPTRRTLTLLAIPCFLVLGMVLTDDLEPGQCVTASWTTGGGTARVQLLRDGAVILDNAQLNNSVQDWHLENN
jgi:hypothetical protein